MKKQTHSCPPGFTFFREDGRGQRVLRGAEPREAGPGTAAYGAGAQPGALIHQSPQTDAGVIPVR